MCRLPAFQQTMPNTDQNPYTSDMINQGRLADYIEVCRQQIPDFVSNHYSLQGAFHLNRLAMGRDILVAPFNFLMGFPNFLLRLLALLFELVGARHLARRLLKIHLGFPTRVQQQLTSHLCSDFLKLSQLREGDDKQLGQILHRAAKEPMQIYVQTRNVAADITAGTLAAILGLTLLHQFTPGSFSAGTAIAEIVAKQQAASGFVLGETLGHFYYTLFPVSPPVGIIALTVLSVMVTIALVAAFSGMLHDPIQKITGIHQRRLNMLLDAIAKNATQSLPKGYRPKDTFVGRIYDLIDWIKGLLSI
ncbi:MAG: hypothetical protein B6D78_01915 [gamma proteobacterium symbiont of Ctena orbiculata]|nr:MAG: hypothetical protein B6D78_01915 [gamma proteobacterium symbiont of Ctena orbiculata]